MSDSLSLVQRKNIRDNEVKMQKHLDLIEVRIFILNCYFNAISLLKLILSSLVQSVSGVKFTVEVDFEKVITDPKLSQNSKDNIGSIIYDQHLGELSFGLKTFCQEPLQKEAVNELATARKITYVFAHFSSSLLSYFII